jgi:hypothetical protein
MATQNRKQNANRWTSPGQAKYYGPNVQAKMYTFGISNTALVAANAIATGVTATAKPVIGLWNDVGTGKNLVVTRATVVATTVDNSVVAPGGFVWMKDVDETVISTGSTPVNCSTLESSGSIAKAFAMGTALTGLVGSLTILRPSPITILNAGGPSTAITQPQGVSVDEVDGDIIVPPGGVLALMNQVSTTTASLSVSITWMEEEQIIL